ncbi:MAG: ABC transporter permease [Chlorobi bacterium]|nr:ABC transporter permease [Chlorobiota bacterium]
MKRFIGFVRKEFYHIFRDPRTMVILFGIPIVQILLFGFVITNEIKDAKIAILDQSHDEITKEITNKLISSGYFILEQKLKSNNYIEDSFKKGNIKEVIVFESNFEQKLEREKKASIQILADASDPNTASMLTNYTSALIYQYLRELNGEFINNVQITPEVRMLYNPYLLGVYMFIPGIMAMILMLISALMTSISLVREKELGTMEVLLVSPLRPLQIVLGKVTPYFFLSFVNALSIVLLGKFVFGMPVTGSFVLLMIESMLFILLALSLGILISTVSDSQQSAMMISMFALLLPTILLSGFIYPIENMPAILQWIAYLMPPRWFIIIIKDIMLKGVGLLYVWKETLVIIFMIFLFIILSVKKFQVRLE